MIEILDCKLEGEVTATPIFEIKGIYDDDEEFHCRLEIRLVDPDPEDLEYELLDGVDLGPEGLDVLEDLLNEIIETEAYRDALEDFEELEEEDEDLYDD